jgi:glucose-1-phosphate thymidylyltransferase
MQHKRVGIVLAGGKGTRLYPLTKVVSKQLLPIYNKPVIYYPIETLVQTGHKQIIIITKPEDRELFKELILSNKEWNCEFIFLVQEEPRGLPDAFNVANDYIINKPSTLILGDNIIQANLSKVDFNQEEVASIFLVEVNDPQNYGVVELDKNNQILSLEEKPHHPKSNKIAIGLYLFDSQVAQKVKLLKPSTRGELEILELIMQYHKANALRAYPLGPNAKWFDIGNFESLFLCNQLIRENSYTA